MVSVGGESMLSDEIEMYAIAKKKPAATPEIATTQVSIITFNAAVSAEAKCRFCLCLDMPYYGNRPKSKPHVSYQNIGFIWVCTWTPTCLKVPVDEDTFTLGVHMWTNPESAGRLGPMKFLDLSYWGACGKGQQWQLSLALLQQAQEPRFFCLWGGQHTRAWLRCKMV